jgi:hypothetical protein
VGILIGYKGSYIFKVYIPLRRGLIKFNKKGLITKPLLKDNTNILIPTKNRGKSTKN